ncbi:DUF3892 domain-containing protein [Listeria monocytogenes]|nr:DUF3892 domain-containing protein [Listeria monocytogenes]
MAEYQIVKIHLDESKNGTEKIGEVQLSNGNTEQVMQVVTNLNFGANYYYTDVNSNRAAVESVQGSNGWYIRTIRDGSEDDNLLSLPTY